MGTLDAEAEMILEELDKWMSVNSEAIHGTRPWKKYGEGPKRQAGGQFNEKNLKYDSGDIRFTSKGKTIYAIVLGLPENKNLTIKSLALGYGPSKIYSVSLLGHDVQLAIGRDATGLKVRLPEHSPCNHAVTLKIQTA
jgi:alpha-L-fucosidase